MFGLGTGEILLIAAVLVLLFGASRIPQLGEALGKTIRGFRRAMGGGADPTPGPDARRVEAHARADAAGPASADRR